MKIGYAGITWGEDYLQFIKDVSSLGFQWIQLRNHLMKDFGKDPQPLIDTLKQYNVKLAMYSLGDANINTGSDKEVLRQLMDQAKFLKSIGGTHSMVTNTSRPKDGNPSKEELKKYAALITELGKQCNDIGIMLTYHNHMGQLGQTPEEVDIILTEANEKYVKFLLDIAHYKQGGGDPAKAILKYKDRLKCLHIKDVQGPNPNTAHDKESYRFVELGRGKVDVPSVFKALNQINFNGWALLELDEIPDTGRTAYQTAVDNKNYLTQKIKLKI